MPVSKGTVIIFFSFAATWLTGCMVGPDFKAPPAPTTQCYTEQPLSQKKLTIKGTTHQSQELIIGMEPQPEWWRLFHFKPLNRLIEQGLKNSPSVEAQRAALQQSQEYLKAGIGSLFPDIQINLSNQRKRLASIGTGTSGNNPFNLYNTSVNIIYPLDFFGGIRRSIEGLSAGVDYQRFLLQETRLTLATTLVTTAITEASLRAQIQATQDLIRAEEQVSTIVQKQFELGVLSREDVLAQTAQLAQTRATLPPIEKNLAQIRHSLAVLIGVLPSEVHLPHFQLSHLKLPSKLPMSLPSQLVQQRPDVRASEALLHHACTEIGVATAQMLPNFTLNGSYGQETNKLNTLFKSVNSIWGYGIQIAQPLFKGGTLRAQRRATIAGFEKAKAHYRQIVLQAFQNVADSLSAIENNAKILQTAMEAETAAFNALTLIKQQFTLGATNYLALLNAERQYQSMRMNRIQADTRRYIDTVALFQALGGGWWHHD